MFGVPRDPNRADKMNPERPLSSADLSFGSLIPPPSSPSNVSNDLVVRALNYHGQQLTSFMKEKKIYQQLDLKNVDYHLYHQRSRELKMEDRGKRLLLHRFISQNSDKLFDELLNPNVSSIRLDNDQVEEHAAVLPPFEAFSDVHEDDRCRHFFDAIVPGDTIFCRVAQKSMSGLMLSVLCLDPITAKSRFIEDIKIRCFCPSAEMIPASDPRDPVRSYESGDIVRVVVLEVKVESQRLLAGMNSASLRPELQNILKLGLVQANDLPATYSYSAQAMDRKIPYSVFLEKSVGFINPTNVAHLASELGLDTMGDSLMKDLSGRFAPEMHVTSLRKEQASKWAFKHVAQGIKFFKSGNNVEAFQCLNQALNIDGENVEGLVARGALYANNGGLDKAVEDFETALKINKQHKNAKKYMCETLIAVARNHEDDNKVDAAIVTYQKILLLVPDHKEALDSIYFLRGRPKDAPLRDDPMERHGAHADKNKPKLVLDEEKERKGDRSEKKKKKKKRRRSSDSSSSNSSSYGSDDSRRRKKKKKKDRNRSKSRSRSLSPFSARSVTKEFRPLSPFSAKMTPGVLGVPAAGVMNMPPEYQPAMSRNNSMNLPGSPLPDVRLELDRIKSQKAEETGGQKSTSLLTEDRIASPPASTVTAPMPGFPVIDLTQPPPGYPPVQYGHGYGHHYPAYDQSFEQDYDDKVRRFLQETGGVVPDKRDGHHSRDHRDKQRHRSRSKNRSRDRRSRDRESSIKKKKKSRRNSRSRSSEKKHRKESSNGDKMLLDDDDFARKLNDHLSGSGGERKRSKSRSKEISRKSRRSRSRDKSGEKRKERVRSGSRSRRREKSKEKKDDSKGEKEEAGGWQSVGQRQFDDNRQGGERSSRDRRESNSAKPMSNVFGSDEEVEGQEKKKKKPEAKKVPASGGMWIPTGEDSILDGVKEAINKLEEKQRFGGRRRSGSSKDEKWDPSRKIKMTEEAPPASAEYDVTFDSRTGMYIRVPRQPKQLTMAEKIAESKVTQMDREKAKDKDILEIEERVVRKLSNSPPRLPTKRRRTPSVGRRSHSRERRSEKSRSREKRRSGRRSRSRKHRSRSRGHRSRSRGHRRSHSRSRSRNRSKKDRTSFDKTNTIQQEITGMREETRRLQSEREAIEREKALLLAGSGSGRGNSNTGQPRHDRSNS